uniref:Uncharacterized protein n=1 Tax=Romanomermis culicivorax TaxID=13658 RepID=A0A915K4X7_ROMCU
MDSLAFKMSRNNNLERTESKRGSPASRERICNCWKCYKHPKEIDQMCSYKKQRHQKMDFVDGTAKNV